MKEHQQLGTAQQSFYAARQAHNILAREQNARASTKPRANHSASSMALRTRLTTGCRLSSDACPNLSPT